MAVIDDLRYSRHLLLDEIGEQGQMRLQSARALVVGAGGLGCAASLYLAASGIGTLFLADGDQVDLTNLQRQILYGMADVGRSKAQAGLQRLTMMNPQCQVIALQEHLEEPRLQETIAQVDVVLDCSDNFATRHAVNRACVAHRVPLISGAAIRFDGQLAIFDSRKVDSPCYHCLYPQDRPVEEVRCALMGIFAPVTGVIGVLQAAEALKMLIACGEKSYGRLLLYDALHLTWHNIHIQKNAHCPVCAA